jgi:hypothetical protein
VWVCVPACLCAIMAKSFPLSVLLPPDLISVKLPG